MQELFLGTNALTEFNFGLFHSNGVLMHPVGKDHLEMKVVPCTLC